jgi:hypothetical protein
MAMAIAASLGCVTRHGTGYWAWNDPGFWSESSCGVAAGEKATVLCVRVADSFGSALQGAKVRAWQSAAISAGEFESDPRGRVQIPVVAGHWHVSVEILGFHSGQHEVDVLPGTQCCVRFELELADSSNLTVT